MTELEMEKLLKTLPDDGKPGFTVDTHARRQRVMERARLMRRFGQLSYEVESLYDPENKCYNIRRKI